MAKKRKKDNPGNYLFLAGLFIGLGTGLYYGRPDVGVLIGLGAGFLAAGIYYLIKKK
jgi:hypothetical protein